MANKKSKKNVCTCVKCFTERYSIKNFPSLAGRMQIEFEKMDLGRSKLTYLINKATKNLEKYQLLIKSMKDDTTRNK